MSFIIDCPIKGVGILLQNNITTGRYLWHVSEPELTDENGDELGCDIRNSIWKIGIEFKKTNAVFAHNSINLLTDMYPIWIDSMNFNLCFWDCENMLKKHRDLGWLKTYDYWRIDTSIYTGPWYIDPFMECGNTPYESRAFNWNYVCTPNPIPPQALTLFNFDINLINVVKKEDIIDLYDNKIQWDGLYPVIQKQ